MGVVAATPRTAVGRVPALGGAAVAGTGLAAACARRALRLAAEVGTAGVDDLVELLVVAVGAAALAWLAGSAAVAATCLVARATGRRWRAGEVWVRRFAPTVVRRTLVVVVAAGLGAASVTTASAIGPTPAPSTTAAADVTPGDDLGWVVTPIAPPSPLTPAPSPSIAAPRLAAPPAATSRADASPGQADAPPRQADVPRGQAEAPSRQADVPPGRTTSSARPAPLPGSASPRPTVVVAPGDSLWGIAARHLPAGATEGTIAAAWPAWYAANAATIGPDPGLIRPGQVLVVPEGAAR